jgi:hypothetical protein
MLVVGSPHALLPISTLTLLLLIDGSGERRPEPEDAKILLSSPHTTMAVQGGNFLLRSVAKIYQKQVGKSLTAYGLKYDDVVNEHCPDTKVRCRRPHCPLHRPACARPAPPRPSPACLRLIPAFLPRPTAGSSQPAGGHRPPALGRHGGPQAPHPARAGPLLQAQVPEA